MKRVTGLGGVFFKCDDPAAFRDWYREHLGIESDDYGGMWAWREDAAPDKRGYTVWGTFAADTKYFAPSDKPHMLNYRVDDLDALMKALAAEGVEIVGDVVTEENGKFGWILDLEGNKVELWEPRPHEEDPYLPPG